MVGDAVVMKVEQKVQGRVVALAVAVVRRSGRGEVTLDRQRRDQWSFG